MSVCVALQAKLQYFAPHCLQLYFDKNPHTEQNFFGGNFEGEAAAVKYVGMSSEASSTLDSSINVFKDFLIYSWRRISFLLRRRGFLSDSQIQAL